jgi:hypothetical protein
MSTIFSDPGWRRGSTLLNREIIDFDDDARTKPTAGKELVGQVKVFQDVNPSTGVRNSNRLVYCVAARYTGSTALTAADAGKVYAFSTASTAGPDASNGPMTEFSAVATATNVTDGRSIGVLDEYLTEDVRTNDIVWLVVKGPTSVQSNGTAIAAGAAIEVTGTAGRVITRSTGVLVASQIAGASVGGTAGALVRVNLHSDEI